mmetsp:Transcript_23342/g.69916  ORF Transcript_23342/g.69916 Transcript_23342/m.69916 type:complete len:146 (-) Transcript_23342:102-539(-)|eukprot:CAMPEP_0119260920 /NCGR_PEP_ID=MMETSP1329-20130426/1143_1 /TAXON_ID=114041 /ORGANISM="Genus nov. species nov., Strain RCC1024" /LENGTH=145 /DNA_ID=CAMNT_0007260397 /DNA_START=181 /DNA_END=618 /DNA_ORIENTATION=+
MSPPKREEFERLLATSALAANYDLIWGKMAPTFEGQCTRCKKKHQRLKSWGPMPADPRLCQPCENDRVDARIRHGDAILEAHLVDVSSVGCCAPHAQRWDLSLGEDWSTFDVKPNADRVEHDRVVAELLAMQARYDRLSPSLTDI